MREALKLLYSLLFQFTYSKEHSVPFVTEEYNQENILYPLLYAWRSIIWKFHCFSTNLQLTNTDLVSNLVMTKNAPVNISLFHHFVFLIVTIPQNVIVRWKDRCICDFARHWWIFLHKICHKYLLFYWDVPFTPTFIRVFIMNECYILSNAFSCIYWDDHVVFVFGWCSVSYWLICACWTILVSLGWIGLDHGVWSFLCVVGFGLLIFCW